ncbi:MAG: hypothetical protein JWR34_7943 [Mycobacterium sp.]|jgi:hypothetical protein|nr:hypothetical protein [Mycobacterium sp. AZCC_0083]MCU1701880.1 hypothetical protein [Mycobacterium sp.]
MHFSATYAHYLSREALSESVAARFAGVTNS